MATKSAHKIGVVTVRETGPRAWQIRWTDPATGKDVRRRLSGLDLSEVRRVAAHISQEALSEKGFLPGRQRGVPTIREAIAEAIRLSSGRDKTKKALASLAAPFVAWLAERYPRVSTWDQLRPAMVQEYLRILEREGKAWDTVRLRLVPIKAAWKHAAENFPEHVRPLPKIKRAARALKEVDCLEPSEVKALLDWLRDRHSDLYCMATLQVLAGLRVLEVVHLRRQDIDFRQGAVTITDTGAHAPKNRGSYRTVPVCSEVREALADYMNGQKIIPASGELFLTRLGNPWTAEAFYHRWKKSPGGVLRQAAEALGLPRLAELQPHRLRSAFATMACRLGVSDRLLKAYLGHAPGDVLGSHYRKITLDDLGLVSGRMDGWRTLAEDRGVWQFSGNSERTATVKG